MNPDLTNPSGPSPFAGAIWLGKFVSSHEKCNALDTSFVAGLEPATYPLAEGCSVQLSYTSRKVPVPPKDRAPDRLSEIVHVLPNNPSSATGETDASIKPKSPNGGSLERPR